MSWNVGICCHNPIKVYTCLVFFLRNEILYTFEVLPWKWNEKKKKTILKHAVGEKAL